MLGSGLINGEIVPPLLQARINKAIQFYKAQNRATLNPPKIVMSGGQGPDELLPESVAMKMYALTQGIPDDDILVEAHSTPPYYCLRPSCHRYGYVILNRIDYSVKKEFPL